jgi:lysine-specific demethylase 8
MGAAGSRSPETRRRVLEKRSRCWADVDDLLVVDPQPVVFRQAFCDWTPVRRWSPDHLARVLASHTVSVTVGNAPVFPSLVSSDETTRVVAFPSLIDELHRQAARDFAGPQYLYLNGTASFMDLGADTAALEPLRSDMRLPPEATPELLIKSALWVGAGGSVSRLHFDGNGCHNLNVQVSGSKEFLIVPPKHANQLDLVDAHGEKWLSHFSRIDPEDLFDDWAQRHGIEHWRFDLAPGDALVIPAFWFHAVRSTGDFNVNVNFWSMPGQAYLSRFLLSLAR